jgi:hypothetical protein
MEITEHERVLLVNSLILVPRAGEPSALVPAGAPPPGRAPGVPPGGLVRGQATHRDAVNAAEPVLAGAAGDEHRAAGQ